MSEARTNARRRATGESQWFNLFVLRRLYNAENVGRGTEGMKSRYDMHPTVTHLTYLFLTRAVPVGRGQYGSPVVELAIRILMVIVCGSIGVDKVAEEIVLATKDRVAVARNLQLLSEAVLRYKHS